jgi:arsenate reductase
LHWGYEDPAEATGTDAERLPVFRRVFIQLGERINQFVQLARREHGDRSIPTPAPSGPNA